MKHDLIRRLESALKHDLPGRDAQYLMAPSGRAIEELITKENNTPRKSAVLILLYYKGNDLYTVLFQRKDYDGYHSKEISLPGGKYENGDEDLAQTALRETHEEIGVNPDDIRILGELSELYIPVSNYDVFPFIGFLNSKPLFVAEPAEVEEILEVKIKDLIAPKSVKHKEMHYEDKVISTPYYDINRHHIWGATAMILSEFLEALR